MRESLERISAEIQHSAGDQGSRTPARRGRTETDRPAAGSISRPTLGSQITSRTWGRAGRPTAAVPAASGASSSAASRAARRADPPCALRSLRAPLPRPSYFSPSVRTRVSDAACPLSTRGGTRLVRLVRGRGGGGRLTSARVSAFASLTRRPRTGCRAPAAAGGRSPSGASQAHQPGDRPKPPLRRPHGVRLLAARSALSEEQRPLCDLLGREGGSVQQGHGCRQQ